jgi:hypothetical protein
MRSFINGGVFRPIHTNSVAIPIFHFGDEAVFEVCIGALWGFSQDFCDIPAARLFFSC